MKELTVFNYNEVPIRTLHKQTGLVVRRYRVNGKLTGFYRNEV